MQRLFHYAFLGIIGLSLAVQTAKFGATLSGSSHPALLAAIEHAGGLVVLGGAVAFFKLLVNLLRSVRQAPARLAALCYGLVLVWPLVLSGILAADGMGAPRAAGNGLAAAADAPPRAESQQFLAGQAWARQNTPFRRSECPGSEEFIRGCSAWMAQARKEQEQAGHAWASANRPQRMSGCTGADPFFVLGCHKWLFEQPGMARSFPWGATTTAECRVEVNANYGTAEQLYLANGNDHGAASNRRRSWMPDLEQCKLIDRKVQDPMMAEAYARLSALLDKMKKGGAPTPEEKAGFLRDFGEMAKVPEQPYKAAYQKLADEYLQREAGIFKEHKTVYPRISCAEYAAKIDEMRKLDAARSAEMLSLKQPDGRIAEYARYQALNEARIAMLWDWKYFTDGAKEAGCKVPQ